MPIYQVPLLKMSLYILGITNMIKIIVELKTLLLKKSQLVNFLHIFSWLPQKQENMSTNLDRLYGPMLAGAQWEIFWTCRISLGWKRPSSIFMSLWWIRQSIEKSASSGNIVSTHTLKNKPNLKEQCKTKKQKQNQESRCGKDLLSLL